jgi:flagellar biosynthesis/type III secretory pathway protein FliH
MAIEWNEFDDQNVLGKMEVEGLTVTVVAAPRSALNGENGPVVMPLAEEKERLLAFADEFIMDLIEQHQEVGAAAFKVGVLAGFTLAQELGEHLNEENNGTVEMPEMLGHNPG